MDSFNADQWSVLESVARGASLHEALDAILGLVAESASDVACSILLFDATRGTLHHGAARRLPPDFIRAIDGLSIGPLQGSCGSAAFHCECIVAEDLSTDPRWEGYRELALTHGLRACWSSPILSAERQLLGTFAIYYRQPRGPTPRELAWVASVTHIAAIAIVRSATEQSLRESEARARQIARLYAVSNSINEAILRLKDAEALYGIACRIAVEQGLAQLAWICTYSPGDSHVRCVARYGTDDGYVDAVVERLGDPRENDSLIGRALTDGGSTVLNDIATDSAAHWRDYPLKQGLRSCGIFPLKSGQRTLAVLNIYSANTGFFRAEEQRMLTTLCGDIAFAVDAAAKEQQRHAVERALRQNEALLRMAGHAARLGAWKLELADDRVTFSDEVCAIHDVPPGTVPSLDDAIRFYAPEYQDLIRNSVATCIRDGTPYDIEARLITAKNRSVWVRAIGQAERASDGSIRCLLGAFQDIDERRKLEEQLVHSQKMEAIGRLAGSVAHDFNNLLSVILSYSQLVLEDLDTVGVSRPDIEAIQRAGERASDLTRQLLAFSRRQVLAPRVIDVNDALRESERLLHRLLGEDIELHTSLRAVQSTIRVDPGQLDQVVMNLSVNARDAMPHGGKLTIETQEVHLDESYASRHIGVTPGPHVMLAISDTGEGMDKATLSRIFEPFFTTKGHGKGTGLGLSTVFGIVQQSGGSIWAYSELGQGTTFKLYFPRAQHMESEPPDKVAAVTLSGNETILLVEDQEEVREVAREILHRHGYTVMETRDPSEALAVCKNCPDSIDLLLTDVVMPQLNGRELAARLLKLRPSLRVLYMSGYTDNAIVHHGILDTGVEYLQKPLVPAALAARVREVLDAPIKRAK